MHATVNSYGISLGPGVSSVQEGYSARAEGMLMVAFGAVADAIKRSPVAAASANFLKLMTALRYGQCYIVCYWLMTSHHKWIVLSEGEVASASVDSQWDARERPDPLRLPEGKA